MQMTISQKRAGVRSHRAKFVEFEWVQLQKPINRTYFNQAFGSWKIRDGGRNLVVVDEAILGIALV